MTGIARSSGTRTTLFWSSTLVALGLLRLPYLSSPWYVLDGDEAVLGVMARHVAKGSELPLYFAGQNYGLAVFETLPAALAFKLFGDSAHILALTILTVFLLGLIAYSRAFRHLSGSEHWARALTIMLAMLPGWVVWSMKARGLYVSGFVLTGCALALLTRPRLSRGAVATAGLLLGLIGLVQPLWLSVTVPLLLLMRRGLRNVAWAGAVAAAVWALPLVLGSGAEAFWRGPRLEGLSFRIDVVPRTLGRAFSGRVAPAQPGVLAFFVGGMGAASFFLMMALMAVDAVRRRSRLALALGLGMVLSLIHVFLLNTWVPRYFLPSTVLLPAAVATWIGARAVPFRTVPLFAAVGVTAAMVLAAVRLGRTDTRSPLAAVPAEEDLGELIAGLEADGVRGVYAPSGDIQWQILFYAGERIPTRGRSAADRYPEFPRAVAEARQSGQPTALVADVRQLQRALSQLGGFPGYRVGERYLRLDDPNVLALALLGFEADPRG